MRYLEEGAKIYTKRGYKDFWDLTPDDEIFIMNNEQRAYWCKNFISPEVRVKNGRMFALNAEDISDDLIIKRRFDTGVVVSGDSEIPVLMDDEFTILRADEIFKLIRRCHKGKMHDIRLFSWGRNIKRKDKYDTVISAPLVYLSSKRYEEKLRELWMLDIPNDLFVFVKFGNNAVFC